MCLFFNFYLRCSASCMFGDMNILSFDAISIHNVMQRLHSSPNGVINVFMSTSNVTNTAQWVYWRICYI